MATDATEQDIALNINSAHEMLKQASESIQPIADSEALAAIANAYALLAIVGRLEQVCEFLDTIGALMFGGRKEIEARIGVGKWET